MLWFVLEDAARVFSGRETLTPVQLPPHFRIAGRTVLVRAIACCLGIMATAAWVSAGEPEKRKFDVPADLAEKSLRVFSVQSGSEVLFSSDAASGVRTNAIKGEFLPGEAVKNMLAGTTLYVRDERDGVFRIAATPRPKAPGAALNPGRYDRPGEAKSGARSRDPPPGMSSTAQPNPLQTSQPQHNESPPMKNSNLLSFLAGWLAAGAVADAQTAGLPTKEDPVILSPFSVSSDKDRGYVATSTLAGTRIKTDLRDLGSSISVVTKEFLDDTGATNLAELMAYTVGTEVAGTQGNFSGAVLGEVGGRPDTDAARRDPQEGARVRGLLAPNFTRNYFSTSIPGEAYNTGGFTFSRGANSVLFGLGSAAGVIDQGLRGAQIGKNAGDLQFRYGSHASNRTTLGYNWTLIPGRLALRLDTLYKTDNYQQEPAFDREKRIYAAVEGVVFENRKSRVIGRTLVRASFEAGEGTRTPPAYTPPTIAYESFFLPPPDYRKFTGTDIGTGGGYDLLVANFKKWQLNDTRPIEVQPGVYMLGWFEARSTAQAAGRPDLLTKTYSSSHIFNQIGYIYGANGAPATIGIPRSNLQGFQGWFLNQLGSFVNTRLLTDGGHNAGFTANSLTNTSVFDYKNHLLTGGIQRVNRRFDAGNVTLEQTFFNQRLGFEATLDRQFYHIDYYQPFGTVRSQPVYIDTSMYLPNGTPNPNAGRAFMLQSGDMDYWRNSRRHNERVTGYYDLKFSDFGPRAGKWLGRHRLAGLWQRESTETKGLNYGMYNMGVGWDVPRSIGGTTLTNQLSSPNAVYYFAYVSDSLIGKEMDQVRLDQLKFNRPRDGDTFNVVYYDIDPTVKPAPNVWKTGQTQIRRIIQGGTAARTAVTGKAFVWQSYLLGDQLVGLVGWRQDRIQDFRQIVTTARSAINEYLPSNLALRDSAAVQPNGLNYRQGDTFSWSFVGRLPGVWVRKLPAFISAVSVHYAESENFSAIAERNDIYNRPIESPRGKTTERGLSLGFAQNRWQLRLNHFETVAANTSVLASQTNSAITQIGSTLTAYQVGASAPQIYPFEQTEAFRRGYRSYDELMTAIKNLLPEPARSIYNYTRNPVTGAWGNQGFIQGLASTSETMARGWEVELVANPTPNWRISTNFAAIETTVSNSAAATLAFGNQVMENMRKANMWGMVEGVLSQTPLELRYMQSVLSSVIAQRAKDGTASQEQRKHRINFVNSYDFREGRFRGIGVGGALRWQSKIATGYPVRLEYINGVPQQIPLVGQPFFAPAEFNGDLWLGYSRKLSEKLRWKIQLNLRNVVGSDQDIPVTTNPDGQNAVYRIAPERIWTLTNTISF